MISAQRKRNDLGHCIMEGQNIAWRNLESDGAYGGRESVIEL